MNQTRKQLRLLSRTAVHVCALVSLAFEASVLLVWICLLCAPITHACEPTLPDQESHSAPSKCRNAIPASTPYSMHVSYSISLLPSKGLGDSGCTTARAKTAVHRRHSLAKAPCSVQQLGADANDGSREPSLVLCGSAAVPQHPRQTRFPLVVICGCLHLRFPYLFFICFILRRQLLHSTHSVLVSGKYPSGKGWPVSVNAQARPADVWQDSSCDREYARAGTDSTGRRAQTRARTL